MTPDPLVDEVRQIRDQIARNHNYDIVSIFRMLRELETKRHSTAEDVDETFSRVHDAELGLEAEGVAQARPRSAE